MVRPPTLKLALLVVPVVLGHLLALEWVSRETDAISGLPAMVPPMYTRLLQPATPPPVVAGAVHPAPVAKPRLRAAPRPKPPASSARKLKEPEQPDQPPEPAAGPELAQPALPPPEQVAQASPPAASAPAAAASAPAAAASAPASAGASTTASAPASAAASAAASAPATVAASGPASAPLAAASAATPAAALAQWPTDTRLSYQLSGQWRSGPLFGDARVQWQREGEKYQVRLDVKIQVFGSQVLTSQGEVTPDGLVPRAYEELRPGKRRMAQFGDRVLTLENGTTVPRPPGVQDTASQFVELAQRFATGKDVLAVGRSVTVWLARPGGVDQWTYDIVGREMLRTPRLGEVEAFHLQPRPIANPRGNITAEMWFAPSLQYLPVRIKVIMGSEAYLDLLVDQIEQR